MEQKDFGTTEEKDKGAEGYATATSLIGSLENGSEIFGDNFGKFEGSFSLDSDESDSELVYECQLCKRKFTGIKPLRQHERSRKHLKALQRIKLQKEIDEESNKKDSNEENSLFEDKTYAECNICKKQFTGIEAYQQHLKSRGHRKKEAYKKLLDQAKEDGKINLNKLNQLIEQEEKTGKFRNTAADSDDDGVDIDELKCSDCEKVFTGLESFYDHMKSKTHKKILKQKELISKLITGKTSGNISGIEVNEDDIVCKLCHLSFTGPENVTAHLKSRGHSKMQEKRMLKKALKETLEKSQTEISEQEDKTESAHESAQASIESKQDSAQVSTENKQDSKESKENTLLCYSKYKNYKKVMEDAQLTQMK